MFIKLTTYKGLLGPVNLVVRSKFDKFVPLQLETPVGFEPTLVVISTFSTYRYIHQS